MQLANHVTFTYYYLHIEGLVSKILHLRTCYTTSRTLIMSIKRKIRHILGNSIHKLDIRHAGGRVSDRAIIKNIVFDDHKLPVQLSSQSEGGFIRILATGPDNAKQISSILKQNQDELGIRGINIIDRVLDYRLKPREDPLFHLSVLVRVDPHAAIKSTLSNIGSEDYLKREIVGHSHEPERVVIDFSSPNIAKPFHFGHLKSTILGNYLANINKFVGNHVTKLNYIGDWGTQYGLLSLGLNEFKSKESIAISPLKYLLDIYVQSNERGKTDQNFYSEARRRFIQLEEGRDPELLNRWRHIRDLSLEELKRSYDRLGVHFDVIDYESDYSKGASDIVHEMLRSNVARKLDDGVVAVDVEKNNKIIQVPVMKSDGASLYISRDVAAAINRREKYNFNKMLYVAGADQEKHFHCLREIVRSLGKDWADQLIHLKMGKVVGMSTRSGNMILLSDIIEEATRQYIRSTNEVPTSKATSADEIEEIAKQLALTALFVYDLRNRRTANYEFFWDQVMMDGQRSGIQLQACYSRLCSLIREAKREGIEPLESMDDIHTSAIVSLEAIHLISLLDEMDSEAHKSYHLMDPCHLVNHGLALSRATNRARRCSWLHVLNEPNELKARSRLTLFDKSRRQLKFIIQMIGLKPLSKI